MKTDSPKETTEEMFGLLLELARESAINLEGVTSLAEEAEGLKPNILARDVIIGDGVKLSHDKEGNKVLDIYIRARYGVKIPQLAWELQKKIQSDIQEKMDILLNDINIHVEGVDMGEEND